MCALTSISVLAIHSPSKLSISSPQGFFQGFSRSTVLMIGLQASAGLLISCLLKYADSVYKSVGACLRGLTLIALAPMFVSSEAPSSTSTLFSAFLVGCGSLAYLSQGPLQQPGPEEGATG